MAQAIRVFLEQAWPAKLHLALSLLLIVSGAWRAAASRDTPHLTASEPADATLHDSIDDDIAAAAGPPRPTAPPTWRLADEPSFAGGANASGPLLLRRQDAASQTCGFWARATSMSSIAYRISSTFFVLC
jgi:hypothetical protein